MSTVSIIGTGAMGSAIADVARRGGAEVELVGRDHAGSALSGDVVVLAVPHAALPELVRAYGDQLAGKVVVDITNPVDFETFDGLTVPAGSSAAAELAQQLPHARVVKAFNTTFAGTLAAGTVGPLTTTVLVAGDDADAKATVARLVEAGGLKAVDAGSLRRAREMEALGFLQITLAAAERIGWTGGFGVAA
ncbi:NADPH-dependent F420 reductase [Actinotalea sp. AC32]|nr:NADPH-dependent F420 reductase [Actinotalea sp. AC32]